MSVEEAANAIVYWLGRYPVKIAPEVFVKETAPSHFQVSIGQVLPQERRRVFEMAPLELEECWQVKELEAA